MAAPCLRRRQLPYEEVVRQGVSFPKQCAQGCTLVKVVESEQLYFVEASCPSDASGFGGYGNAYLVQHEGSTIQLCYITGWIS